MKLNDFMAELRRIAGDPKQTELMPSHLLRIISEEAGHVLREFRFSVHGVLTTTNSGHYHPLDSLPGIKLSKVIIDGKPAEPMTAAQILQEMSNVV